MSIYTRTAVRRSRIKRRAVKRKDANPEYLRWIHELTCCIPGCWKQPVEAHHAGDHGLSQRAPDRTAIPLCIKHHRIGAESAHTLGKGFWEYHNLNRDVLIKRMNEVYDATH